MTRRALISLLSSVSPAAAKLFSKNQSSFFTEDKGLSFGWSKDDVIKAKFRHYGYPPRGQFCVVCSELVDNNHWPYGDFRSLKKAVRTAKQNTWLSDWGVYSAGVYDHRGRELRIT